MITRDDLMGILLAAVHMAKVDRQFVAEEHQLLSQLMSCMELTGDERGLLQAEQASLSDIVAGLSSDAARHLLVKSICAVAAVDGLIAASEARFLNRIHSIAGDGMAVPAQAEWRSYVEEVRAAFSASPELSGAEEA